MADYMRDFIIKVLLMLAGMLILLIAVTIWEMVRETEVEPDVIIPMTNQHIEWTGAGYGG